MLSYMELRGFKGWQVVLAAALVVLGVLVWLYAARQMDSGQAGYKVQSLSLERSSTGGLSGRGDGKNFRLAGSQITFNNKVSVLSQPQAEAIIRKIDAAQFFDLQKSYDCKGCADQITYTLNIALNGQAKTVRYEDGSNAPPSLLELDRYLKELVP
jgi:hypothetical protein